MKIRPVDWVLVNGRIAYRRDGVDLFAKRAPNTFEKEN